MIYSNNDSKLSYSGKWETFVKEGITIFSSAEKGAFVEFEFYGTGFIWYAHTNKWRGKANVYVDGKFMVNVDLYSLNEVLNVKAYSIENLPNKSHNVKIEVLGERNTKSIENKVTIQKFEISQEEIIEEIIEVEEIKVTEEVVLKKGESLQLEWQIIPENATDKSVIFESGNTGFVSVSDEGLLTYINEGETNVSIKASNGKVSYVKVICEASIEEEPIIPEQPTIPPSLNEDVDFSNAIDSTNLISEGILIANEGCVMNIKDKEKIIAHILPYFWSNTNPYILKSSNSEVIKINDGQVIEAVGIGSATITAYTIDGKYKHSVNYEVAKKEELNITKVYNLELDRFNIMTNNNDESTAINNSLGINSALQFCSRYGYEKLVFPSNSLIYIEPKKTINMVSDLIVDLNGSELKLRANNYNSYSAINFEEGTINLLESFDLSLYNSIKTTINSETAYKITVSNNVEFYSNKIKVKGYVDESQANQILDYYNYGDKITLNYRHGIDKKNATKYNFILYIEYLNDDNILYKDKITNLNFMNTKAQYCTGGGGSVVLRSSNDYNFIRIKIEGEIVGKIDYYMSLNSTLSNMKRKVLQNSKLCNGTITGERDEKNGVYPNWWSVGATEGGVSILFSEGYNNGIENVTVRKSIGFNMASGVGKNSYGVSNFANYPIRHSDFEFGEFDQYGNPIDNNNVIRTKNFMNISNIKGEHYDIGYPLGYHGYPYVNSRICDVYFYNINKELIKRDRGILRFRTYSKPNNAYYAKFVFHINYIPSSGNSDFGGAVAFFENFNPPTKNYIKNCIIEDNYSCGFAACGGQKWIITDNIWRRNAGRMPGCDIDWEDGWEYMQGDLIENNSFESYNNCILCAGSGNIYNNNRFAGQSQFWGRSQYWTFVNNTLKKGEYTPKVTLSTSSDCHSANNKFIEGSLVFDKNHSEGNYECYSNNEVFEKSSVLNGTFKTVNSKFSLGCGFTGKELEKCEITDKLDLKGNINNCIIKKSVIKPSTNSNITINNSELYNVNFNLMNKSKDVVLNNCRFVFECKKNIITPTSFAGAVGIIFNNCVFEFKTINEYYSLLGGWDANNCIGTYTFNKCTFKVEEGFKGYFTDFSWYPTKDNTNHITINFIDTDASMFIPSPKEIKSNIVIRK